ncbi:protein IQ-domain 26 [Spinacia oleracea]|uniref:Protein IQ-domain 26 n=1 Tax=Spinacia oleracea TaxID=3562 RepID=A0A9R0K4W7_SPIOL|nr:protein IQ-domain 26-like [Spinacia oleracea]
MGRATRWLKSFLGMKKQNDNDKPTKSSNNDDTRREKMGMVEKRWSFTKPTTKERVREKENQLFRDYIFESEKEQTKHAIAVAAATAAAADAAVAAAHAAVAVVRLTSHGRGTLFSCAGTEKWAAVKIQTLFRSYLARRALKALKGLVKLQAHVRGYLVRKRAAATLHSMQALIRAQASARSQRANNRSSKLHSEFRSRKSMERVDETRCDEFHSKRISTSYDLYNDAYEGSPKIVEIDTYNKPKSRLRSRSKSRSRSKRINPSMYDFSCEYPTMSSPLPYPYPGRVTIPDCQKIHHEYDWSFYGDECRISTAQSTPRLATNGPLTPTKSVCGDSFFRPYSNFPSYMADTQSFRAKSRSQSAPKQRPEGRAKTRLSLGEIMAARNSISSVRMQRSISQVQDTFNL